MSQGFKNVLEECREIDEPFYHRSVKKEALQTLILIFRKEMKKFNRHINAKNFTLFRISGYFEFIIENLHA